MPEQTDRRHRHYLDLVVELDRGERIAAERVRGLEQEFHADGRRLEAEHRRRIESNRALVGRAAALELRATDLARRSGATDLAASSAAAGAPGSTPAATGDLGERMRACERELDRLHARFTWASRQLEAARASAAEREAQERARRSADQAAAEAARRRQLDGAAATRESDRARRAVRIRAVVIAAGVVVLAVAAFAVAALVVGAR